MTCYFRNQKRVFKTFNVSGRRFRVDIRYEPGKCIGKGAYGVVCAANDNISGHSVAIKKVESLFADLVDAKRILREIKVRPLFGMPA